MDEKAPTDAFGAPQTSPELQQRATAGEEVWQQLGLQFLWICVVQGVVIGACGASASSSAAKRLSCSAEPT